MERAEAAAGQAAGEDLAEQLGRLRVATLRLAFRAEDALVLPPYKGSTLRGGFGASLKKLVCTTPERPTCSGCLLHHACVYGLIFETPPPPGSPRLSKYRDVPRPFVFVPPRDTRTAYEPGETLEFLFRMFGRTVDMLVYPLVALDRLGQQGLGRGRGRARLLRALAQEGSAGAGPSGEEQVFYEGGSGFVRPYAGVEARSWLAPALAEWEKPLAGATGAVPLHLRFLTPTRITFTPGDQGKRRGDLHGRPDFHAIFRSLLRRLSALLYFHQGVELAADFRGLVGLAARVRLAEDRTYWVDWERYSNRQGERMRLGGFVGEAVYEAPAFVWRQLLPFVLLAPVVHVGKNTTFGLGQVEVRRAG